MNLLTVIAAHVLGLVLPAPRRYTGYRGGRDAATVPPPGRTRG